MVQFILSSTTAVVAIYGKSDSFHVYSTYSFLASALRHDSDDLVVESIHDIVISRYIKH